MKKALKASNLYSPITHTILAPIGDDMLIQNRYVDILWLKISAASLLFLFGVGFPLCVEAKYTSGGVDGIFRKGRTKIRHQDLTKLGLLVSVVSIFLSVILFALLIFWLWGLPNRNFHIYTNYFRK